VVVEKRLCERIRMQRNMGEMYVEGYCKRLGCEVVPMECRWIEVGGNCVKEHYERLEKAEEVRGYEVLRMYMKGGKKR
jgi:hypothetical protein